MDIQHKPGKENVVPDVLSRKHQLNVVYVGEIELQKEVRLGSRRDEFAKERKCRNPTLKQVGGWDSHSQKWELGALRDSRNFRAQL